MNAPARKGSLGGCGIILVIGLVVFSAANILGLLWLDPDWLDAVAVWRGPIIPPDNLEAAPRPATAPRDLRADPPAIPLDKNPLASLDFSLFRTVDERTGWVSRDAGGAVLLADGSGIELPPGALAADTTVTVRHLALDEPQQRGFTVTDIDVGGQTLAVPATVVLPCPSGHPALARLPKEYKVFHHHDGQVTELPAEPDAAGGTVRVQTTRCSPFTVVGLVAWRVIRGVNQAVLQEVLNDFVADYRCDPPLQVPYYAQGHSNWCFAAATGMLMKAHGGHLETWDIASRFKLDFLTALLAFTGYWSGGLDPLYAGQGLVPDLSHAPWTEPLEATLFIVENLRQGRPVFVDVYGIQHAVVAVGFNETGLYLHDPAGTLVIKSGRADGWDLYKQGRLAAVLIPWEQFIALCRYSPVLQLVYTSVVTNRPVTGSPVTVTVLSDDLQFIHPLPAPFNPRSPWKLAGVWDGREPGGIRFQAGRQGPYWPDVENSLLNVYERTTPLYPSLSDKVFLRATLANASPNPAEVEVAVSLNGTTVGAPVKRMVPGPGGTAGPPYTSHAYLDIGPLSGIDLPQGLAPGSAMLRVEARVGGQVVDFLEQPVQFGPAVPTNLRLESEQDEIILRWDPVPHAGVEYQVYYVEQTPGPGTQQAVTPDTRWPVDGSLLKKKGRRWLYVVARHASTDLLSPPSSYLDLGDPWVGRWSGKMILAHGSLADVGRPTVDALMKTWFGEKEEGGAAVRATLDQLLAAADILARAGIPMTFEITRPGDAYQLYVHTVAGFPNESKEKGATQVWGPNTLCILAGRQRAEATPEIAANPPFFRLHRWNEIRNDWWLDLQVKDQKKSLKFRFEFERK